MKLALILAFFLSDAAYAWDGVVTGKVSGFDVVANSGAAHNFDFRVYLSGISSFCSGAPIVGWAYINNDDAQYNQVISSVMMAYSTGTPLTIYTNRSNGYCSIGYISVR